MVPHISHTQVEFHVRDSPLLLVLLPHFSFCGPKKAWASVRHCWCCGATLESYQGGVFCLFAFAFYPCAFSTWKAVLWQDPFPNFIPSLWFNLYTYPLSLLHSAWFAYDKMSRNNFVN